MPHEAGTQIIKAPGRGATGPGGNRPRPAPSASPGLGTWQAYDLSQLVQLCTTIRYVRKTGNDSNGGTNPSTDAWLTINHALQTATAGTIIYVGAGSYRETVTVANNGTAVAPIALVGDVDGSRTGDAGSVILTAWQTNDTTAPSGSTLLTMNGKSNLYFQNVYFVTGQGFAVDATTKTSQRVCFRDCAFQAAFGSAGNGQISVNAAAGVPLYWLIDRCYFMGPSQNQDCVVFDLDPGMEYDLVWTIQNSLFLSMNNAITGGSSSSSSLSGGGIKVLNNTFLGCCSFNGSQNQSSTKFPHRVIGNVIWTPKNDWAIQASAGYNNAIFEDYNIIYGRGFPGGFPSTGQVNSGGHSKLNTYAPLFHFGQERIWGGQTRPFGEPMAGSPLLAFGSLLSDPGQLDLRLGARAMSSSGGRAAGAYQRGNNLTKETGTVHSGSNAISITGPGFQDFQVPVSSGAINLSLYCQYDSSYAGPPPMFQVLPNQTIGVGSSTIEFPSAQSGVWQQATIPISPSGSGIVVVRAVSSDTSGSSKVAFDTFAAA